MLEDLPGMFKALGSSPSVEKQKTQPTRVFLKRVWEYQLYPGSTENWKTQA